MWRPQPGPQTLAYHSLADELFYGGAAGGGKSDLVLGLATTAHRKSLILRRQATQLSELVTRSQEIIGSEGRFNASSKTWRDVAGGRRIEFGGCDYENDKQAYKGRAHDLKAFDELPDFSESQYTFIGAWNRSVVPGQRCRKVGTGNPPSTAEGEWVIRRWAPWLDKSHARPAEPGELRWYAIVDGAEVERENGEAFTWKEELIQPYSRTFIPAKLDDNPILQNTGYSRVLDALPEPLRSQLKHGDFTVGREDDRWQVIPTRWIEAAVERGRRQPVPPRRMECLGVDVARGGKDKLVLAPRHGGWFGPLLAVPGIDAEDGFEVVRLIQLHLEPDAYVNLDIIGVGASPYDLLRLYETPVHGINFAEGTQKRDRTGRLRMRNVRAAAYWHMRELLDPASGEDIALPDDPELVGDLCAPRWSLTMGGVLVEAKEDIAKRIGRSPDKGDAVVLAAWQADDHDVEDWTGLV